MSVRREKTGALQELLQGALDLGKRGIEQTDAREQNEIISRLHPVQKRTESCSQTTLCPVSLHGITQGTPDYQANARERVVGNSHDQDDKRMCVGFAAASRLLEVGRARQTKTTLHTTSLPPCRPYLEEREGALSVSTTGRALRGRCCAPRVCADLPADDASVLDGHQQ